MKPLGSLASVDLREIWPNEAYDFTPWLARDENIRQLSDALGMELEVDNTEVAVGPYSADILARDSGSSSPVVIENQLGKTNHDHLGKLITYGAHLDASAVVWIASDFTDEHRRALDWLNDNTSGDVGYYGVRVELWKIDTSNPAVRFNVLSRPADQPVVLTGLSDLKKQQLAWWTRFHDALVATNTFPSVRPARPQQWYNVAIGRSGFHLSNTVNFWDNQIAVRLYMRKRYNADAALSQLLESKSEIENEIGMPLVWNPYPDKTDKVIILSTKAALDDPDKWEEAIQWLVDKTVRFRTAFAPRVKKLDLDVETEDADSGE